MTEAEFWGTCANSFHEEQKQLVYAPRMGLTADWSCAHPPTFDLEGRSVIDIGGGPVSLLLKTVSRGFPKLIVWDPAEYPKWVRDRYFERGVEYRQSRGEDLDWQDGTLDEAWIYNVLQHVDDPAAVIANAQRAARLVRLFEWVDIDPYPGHPNRLEVEQLDEWLGSKGFVAYVDEEGAVGRAYYGVFDSAASRDTVPPRCASSPSP